MKKFSLHIFWCLLIMASSNVFAQGTAMDFNGTSVTLGTAQSNLINDRTVTDRTIECWFQPNDVSSTTKQIIYEEGGRHKGFNIYIESDTLYCGVWANDGLMDDGLYLKTTDISDGQWVHIAITLNGATAALQSDIFKGYLNGVEFGSGAATRLLSHSGATGWGNQTGRTQFHDGETINGHNFFFNGKIEDFKIWNTALTEDEIREGMNTQLDGTETDLVLYYQFDDTIAPIVDETGNHAGTVYDGGVSTTTFPSVASTIYTTWDTGNGSSDWTSALNWSNGVPGSSSSGLLKIPSGGTQPIISTAVTGKSLQIENGGSLEITSSGSLTLSGSAEINGATSLVIKSDATGTGNFIDGGGVSYKNSGSVRVERFIDYAGAGYHYVSSPINNHLNLTGMTHIYSYDETTLTWLNYLDGTDGFTNFSNATGYAYRYLNDVTGLFTGSLNTGDYTVGVTSTNHGGDVFQHFNLLGNPYPSSISADSLVDNNSSVIAANVYFWNGEDYATYNTGTNAGTAGALGATPDGNIAVGQGFYVDATSTGDVTFSNSMRGTDSDIFYRQESYPQLRVMLNSANGRSDLYLTGHRLSTVGADDYDARQFPGNGNLSLSALLDGVAYDIQSVPQIDAKAFDLQVVAKQAGDISFGLQDLKDLDGMEVYLEDREMGTVTNIKEETYHTFLSEGTHNNRFKLRIAKAENIFTAWVNNGQIESFVEGEIPQSARLIALDGKTVATSNSMQFNNWSQLSNGVYLLEVTTDLNRHTIKIIK